MTRELVAASTGECAHPREAPAGLLMTRQTHLAVKRWKADSHSGFAEPITCCEVVTVSEMTHQRCYSSAGK